MVTESSHDTARAQVAVVIPARNEAVDIADAIRSIGRQDFGPENIEVVVVDGNSTDTTADVAKRTFDEFAFARAEVAHNADGRTPVNLNRGVMESESPIVIRVDARSRIPERYVSAIVEVLQDQEIAVVGGRQVAVPPHDTRTGHAIARALNNSFGMGLSRYRRRDVPSGPADTVYLGAFRRCQLEEVGGWSERMASNQDFELNRRLSSLGLIWVEADLDVSYIPRATVKQILAQYHRFGRWKVEYWRSTGDRPQGRQLALMLGPAVGVSACGALLIAVGAKAAACVVPVAALGLLAVDHVGSGGEPAPLGERTIAAVTNAAVGVGWLSGIARETLKPELSNDIAAD